MMRRARIALSTLVIVAAACTGPLVKVAPEPPTQYVTTTSGQGSACGFSLFGVIPIAVNDRAQRAYDEALKASGGTGLTDVNVTERWYWAYIGVVFCTDIDGVGYTAAQR